MGLLITIFGFVYTFYGVMDSKGNIVRGNLHTSMYFSIVTWTTLGYGDVQPTENLRWVAALEALLGYVYMGIFTAFLWAVVTQRWKSIDYDSDSKVP